MKNRLTPYLPEIRAIATTCGIYGPGGRYSTALRLWRAKREWDALEKAGLVRLRWEPDDFANFDDLAGDCFDEGVNADSVPGGVRTIRAQKKAFEREIEREGVWGLIGEYRTHPGADWTLADSCWGFVGQDANDYTYDIQGATIDALRAALKSRCPVCHRPRP